jgi:hypothetical protein
VNERETRRGLAATLTTVSMTQADSVMLPDFEVSAELVSGLVTGAAVTTGAAITADAKDLLLSADCSPDDTSFKYNSRSRADIPRDCGVVHSSYSSLVRKTRANKCASFLLSPSRDPVFLFGRISLGGLPCGE